MAYRGSRGRYRRELEYDYRYREPRSRPSDTLRTSPYTRESTIGSNYSRFERNESYDYRPPQDRRDQYRSGYVNEHKSSYRNNTADRYEESYKSRYDYFDDRNNQGRETFHSRNSAAFGGSSRGRGRGRGRGSFNAGFTRGTKRYTEQPKSGAPFKRRKLSDTESRNFKKYPPTANYEDRKPHFWSDRQKHRKHTHFDKYNSQWMAYTCSFCKFKSFDKKRFEEHLESEWHKEILDHIRKQTNCEKTVINFFHEITLNKCKKVDALKVRYSQNEEANVEKDILKGVTPKDHMEEVRSVHCSACDLDIPPVHLSVQLHRKSPEHLRNRGIYRDKIKIKSLVVASSILDNPVVNARYELFLKGEYPFGTQEAESEAELDAVDEIDVAESDPEAEDDAEAELGAEAGEDAGEDAEGGEDAEAEIDNEEEPDGDIELGSEASEAELDDDDDAEQNDEADIDAEGEQDDKMVEAVENDDKGLNSDPGTTTDD